VAGIINNVLKTVSYGELICPIRITFAIICFDFALYASGFCLNSGPIHARPNVKGEFAVTPADVRDTLTGDETAISFPFGGTTFLVKCLLRGTARASDPSASASLTPSSGLPNSSGSQD
jgi:hypothetical protein